MMLSEDYGRQMKEKTMAIAELKTNRANIDFYDERVDLAAAFRWAVKLNWHEGVANHFSLAVNDDGTQFLMNPNHRHFSRIKASDLLFLTAITHLRQMIRMRLIRQHGDYMDQSTHCKLRQMCSACVFDLRNGASIAC